MNVAVRTPSFVRLVRAELLRLASRRSFRWLAMIAIAIIVLTYSTVVLPAIRNLKWIYALPDTNADPRFEAFRGPGLQIAISAIRAAFFPPLLGLGLLIGSSHVGAEWASRGVTNLLFWEPRRMRVLAAKFLAVGGALFVGSLGVLSLLMLSLALGPGDGLIELAPLLLFSLRAATLVAVTSILGAAIAAVARSTTAGTGVAFVLLAIGEPLLYANFDGYENIGIAVSAARVLQWSSLGSQTEPLVALLILFGYATAFMAVAISVFRKQEMG